MSFILESLVLQDFLSHVIQGLSSDLPQKPILHTSLHSIPLQWSRMISYHWGHWKGVNMLCIKYNVRLNINPDMVVNSFVQGSPRLIFILNTFYNWSTLYYWLTKCLRLSCASFPHKKVWCGTLCWHCSQIWSRKYCTLHLTPPMERSGSTWKDTRRIM